LIQRGSEQPKLCLVLLTALDKQHLTEVNPVIVLARAFCLIMNLFSLLLLRRGEGKKYRGREVVPYCTE
jgi:hypothetical protein